MAMSDDVPVAEETEHPHDEHAEGTREVSAFPVCDNRLCFGDGKYVYHTLQTEPVYCSVHLGAPPYHDQLFIRLVLSD